MKPPAGFAYRSPTFKGALERLNPDQLAQAREGWEHYRAQFERVEGGDPVRVAFSIHELIDEEVAIARKRDRNSKGVQCRKGCANCCNLHISVMPAEAVLLRTLMHEVGMAIDEARLDRQAGHDADTWRDLAPADRRCVFLGDDNACTVYEHRPSACRKYFVVTAPDLCNMEKHPGGRVGVWFSPLAEMIDSASMTVLGYGSLAEELIAARDLEFSEQEDAAPPAQG